MIVKPVQEIEGKLGRMTESKRQSHEVHLNKSGDLSFKKEISSALAIGTSKVIFV